MDEMRGQILSHSMAERSGRSLLQVRLRDTDAAWNSLISGLVELSVPMQH